MGDLLQTIYQDMQQVANICNTISSTLSDVDNVASPIADALIASAAIGDEIGAAIGETYEGEIHPVIQEVIQVCNTINQFLTQAINVLQTADQVAGGNFSNVGSGISNIASLV